LGLKRFLLLLLPVALLLGAGCGGDDSPSKDEYVAQADAVCRDADDALNQEIQEAFGAKPPTERQIVAFSESNAIPNLEGQLADLRALTPPEGEEETLTRIYDTLEEAIAQIKEDPASDTVPPALEEARKQAKEFGMVVCGSS
jgi:hypothetical protein